MVQSRKDFNPGDGEYWANRRRRQSPLTRLSVGERQRVTIARALIKNPPPIIIPDEATSSLDAESEAMVQEALERLMKGRTTFVIAHRLSAVVNAARIIMLAEGRVVESGTHRELMRLAGYYASLVKRVRRADSFGMKAKRNCNSPSADCGWS